MASNQLGDDTRKQILVDLNKIFGRAVGFFTFPLTEEEDQLTLARAGYSNSLIASIKEVEEAAGEDLFRKLTRVQVRLGASDRDCARVNMRSTDYRFTGAPASSSLISWGRVYERLGHVKAEALLEWVNNTGTISLEIERSLATLDLVLKMAKTPGQLRRMVPELVQHLRIEHRRLLAGQARASSVPYEWSAFNRNHVESATNTIAKCKLLPETDILWNDLAEHTWISLPT